MSVIVVSGVGTEVGKTHVATALTRALASWGPVLGYKPVESGVEGPEGPDERQLRSVSTFHVKHPLPQVRLRAAVSPHLAARLEGRAIELRPIADAVETVRAEARIVVELPGGLFSPLSRAATNADLAAILRPDALLIVAANRLGVLHDVRAVAEACRARALAIAGVVLSAVERPDASSDSNADELAATSGLALLASLPRGPALELAASAAFAAVVRCCVDADERTPT